VGKIVAHWAITIWGKRKTEHGLICVSVEKKHENKEGRGRRKTSNHGLFQTNEGEVEIGGDFRTAKIVYLETKGEAIYS